MKDVIFVLVMIATFVVAMCTLSGARRAVGRGSAKIVDLGYYEFPALVREVFRKEHPGLSPEHEDLAFKALKEYFILLLLEREAGRRGSLGMPSCLADEAWHSFILCTQAYDSFCDKFFGQKVHHRPAPSADPAELNEHSVFKDEVVRTWMALAEHGTRYPLSFRKLGPNEAPLLFALDMYAGFTPGWYWSQPILAALAATQDIRLESGKKRNSSNRDTSGSSCGGDAAFVGVAAMTGCAASGGDADGGSSATGSGSGCGSSCGGGCGGGGD